MPRLAIGIEYDGTPFSGWQRQQHAASIQEAVERALSGVADDSVSVSSAGRTDAGVHATGQVAHFDTSARRDLRSWLLGANSNLPREIGLTWVREVSSSFDARYSAQARTYHYLVLNRKVRSALHRDRAWWVAADLDVAAMRSAAGLLIGEHDFSAFRAAQCQAKSPKRDLQRLQLLSSGPFLIIECRANAFLHHMVRNIVGSLVRVGRGEAVPGWIGEVLESRDRRAAGMTAPACGLYLTHVHYPPALGLPGPGLFWPGDLRA